MEFNNRNFSRRNFFDRNFFARKISRGISALRELIFAGINFRDFANFGQLGQKQRITPGDDRRNIKSRKLIPAKINSLKVINEFNQKPTQLP